MYLVLKQARTDTYRRAWNCPSCLTSFTDALAISIWQKKYHSCQNECPPSTSVHLKGDMYINYHIS